MRILLARVAPFLGRCGGMERVCCRMANAMAERGHVVGILFDNINEGTVPFPLREDIHLFNIGTVSPHRKKQDDYVPVLGKTMRECVRLFSKSAALSCKEYWRNRFFAKAYASILQDFQPDIIISFDPASSTVFLGDMPGDYQIPVITMFHFPVESGMNWNSAREQKTITGSAAVQVLMPYDEVKLKKSFPAAHVVCIPNMVPRYDVPANLDHDGPYRILHVGRIAKQQKQQHLLIEAYASLARRFPNWTVEFYGNEVGGQNYTTKLLKMIYSYGLEDRVFLRGVTDQVANQYRRADLFVFPSAFEGFGLAPAEAMSAGLPVVAYRSCEAVSALIADGKTGLLAEDGTAGLADQMAKLMEDKARRIEMGKAARVSMEAYAPDRIWQQWETLIEETMRRYQHGR